MKYILFTFLILSLKTAAQDCQLFRETDPYTKETKLSSGFVRLQGASLSMDANKLEIDFLFSLEGRDKCFTDASTAAVFFEGSKVKFTQRNSGSMNCEGFFHFIFRNNNSIPSLLQKMSTQKLSKIVFTGNDKRETMVSLSAEQQKIVMDLATCMVKEAPTIIK